MKALLIVGILLLTPHFFAQKFQTLILDSNYFNRSDRLYTNCSDALNLPVYISDEVKRITDTRNIELAYYELDSIQLGNGTFVYPYALSEANANALFYDVCFYLADKNENGYISYKVWDKGNPDFTTSVKSTYAEIVRNQYLNLYSQNNTSITVDLYGPFAFVTSVIGFMPNPPGLDNDRLQLYWCLGGGSPWNLNLNMPELNVSIGKPGLYILNKSEVVFDAQAYLTQIEKAHFFSVLCRMPNQAQQAKHSAIDNSLYRLSNVAFAVQVKAVKDTLQKQTPKKG